MCDAVSIAYVGLALSAAGSAAQYENTRQTASKTADATKHATEMEQLDLQRQQAEQDAAASGQMNEAARKALHDSALFDVVAGEFGGGASVDRARSIGNLQANENLATIAANAENQTMQNQFSRLATLTQAKARLASINQPSLLGTALQIGGAATKAYGDVKRAEFDPEPARLPYDYNYRGTVLPNSLRGGQ